MVIFLLLISALGAMGVLAICSIEPARRTFLESVAITLLFGFTFVVALVIYLGVQPV